MNRTDFHKFFGKTGPVITPVIHVLDESRTRENIRVAMGEGAAGIFLINHDFGVEPFLPIIRDARAAFPDLWLGLNFLAVTGRDAFPVLGDLGREGCRIDAYWGDDARIDERVEEQAEANEIDRVRATSGWDGLYFGGTVFKKQRDVAPDQWETSARIATSYMDVVTTSGIATGQEADLGKIDDFRRGIGDHALAVASGITPENAGRYHQVDCFLVATGINKDGDFYNMDAAKLAKLIRLTETMEQI